MDRRILKNLGDKRNLVGKFIQADILIIHAVWKYEAYDNVGVVPFREMLNGKAMSERIMKIFKDNPDYELVELQAWKLGATEPEDIQIIERPEGLKRKPYVHTEPLEIFREKPFNEGT